MAEKQPKKWGQKVAKEIERKGTEGTFTAAAKSGESTREHVSRVLAPGSQASTKMKRKAQFLRNIAGMEKGGTAEVDGVYLLHKSETVVPAMDEAGWNKAYSVYCDAVRPEGASSMGTTEHPSKYADTQNGAKKDFLGRTPPAASKVEDAKDEPGAALSAVRRQVGGNVRNDSTTSSFGGKPYKA